MSDTVIQVENLGKRYRIGGRNEAYGTLRDALVSAVQTPVRMLRKDGRNSFQEIWALQDVSFEVSRGEVLGIIGRNGAGKSTLLKVLSRVTHPTTGRAKIHGRVGSLLEVGTGFHPELTGRENIYLNGAILGMKKNEIQRKFDEIVDFAELEKFLDTPVKRYSSGMYMRLAFSVAAHLEPEILVVDEVLAVGDTAFQKKCLGKMGEVAKEGRTVLFVSHNMAAIHRLCHTAILLEKGRLGIHGTASEVIQSYLQEGVCSSLHWKRSFPPTKPVYFQSIYIADEMGKELDYVTTASSLSVVMEYAMRRRYRNVQLSVDLLDGNGDLIFASNPQDSGFEPPEGAGQYRAIVRLPAEILLAKMYGIRTNLWTPWDGMLDTVDSFRFSVQETDSLSNQTPEGKPGQLLIRCNWLIQQTYAQT